MSSWDHLSTMPVGRRNGKWGIDWIHREFSWEFETKEMLKLYNKIVDPKA